MATSFQLTFDAADPEALAGFWCAVLGYRLPDPPTGFDTWQTFAEAQGWPEESWHAFAAAEDPDGVGRRLFFQRVPEGKTAKNRIHLDVNVGGGHAVPADERAQRVDAEVERLVGLGATRVEAKSEWGSSWVVMTDPEGNEFCLQ